MGTQLLLFWFVVLVCRFLFSLSEGLGFCIGAFLFFGVLDLFYDLVNSFFGIVIMVGGDEMKALGERMKEYEKSDQGSFTFGVPVILRFDGKSFHTLTRKMEKPFDPHFGLAMLLAADKLAHGMQGVEVGYLQSDEVSFLLTGYRRIESQPWFGNNIQKMVSVGAGIMTMWFNWYLNEFLEPEDEYYFGVFDGRGFNIPEHDVANYFLWRAKDNHRNSVMMYARSIFSHKELNRKNISDIHEMLHEKGKNWATDVSERFRNGAWLFRDEEKGWTHRCDILPSYKSVSGFIDENVIFREVTS